MSKLIKTTMDVNLIFQEEILGSTPGDPDIARNFFDQAPTFEAKDEEIETYEEMMDEIEKRKTIFPKENNKPFIWDYQIKGFLKDACGMLRRISGTESSKIKNYQKVIDGLIFVEPRKIFLILPNGSILGECQRPLRGKTPQGERTALAISESAPAGTKINFRINVLSESLLPAVHEWLEYGSMRGLSQWRNSGKGKFLAEVSGAK